MSGDNWIAHAVDGEGLVIKDADETRIAVVHGYTDHPGNVQTAMLIAAAPQLLDALEKTLNALTNAFELYMHNSTTGTDTWAFIHGEDVVAQAESAITSATQGLTGVGEPLIANAIRSRRKASK